MSSKVVSGEYKGRGIVSNGKVLAVAAYFIPSKNPVLNRENVSSLETIGDRANVTGSVIKGAVGGALFGTVGLAFGLGKGGQLHKVMVEWKNGKKSMLELNEKDYNTLLLNF